MVSTIEYHNVDKSLWGAGPWQQEPDKRQWQDEATGAPCLIVRGPVGALCGYVGVLPGHPLYRVGYSAENALSCDDNCENGWHSSCRPEAYLTVHGGLTFSGGCGHGSDPSRGICHVPEEGEPDDVWWFGFDCAHAGDLTPMLLHSKMDILQDGRRNGEVYRDLGYVTAEVSRLASQLAGLSQAQAA